MKALFLPGRPYRSKALKHFLNLVDRKVDFLADSWLEALGHRGAGLGAGRGWSRRCRSSFRDCRDGNCTKKPPPHYAPDKYK